MLINASAVIFYIISSFVFHYGILSLGEALSGVENAHKKGCCAALLAVVNFALLFFVRALLLGIIINWLIMTVALYIEVRFFLKFSHLQSLFISLEVCIFILSAELFYRAFFAILTNQPLQYFDSMVTGLSVWKTVPVTLAYLLAGIVLWMYSKSQMIYALKNLFSAAKPLRFFFLNMLLAILFLVLQIFLYKSDDNTLQIKLWGLSAAAYILIGYHFAFRYAVRIATLYHFSVKNKLMEETIKNYRKEEDELREIVEYDELTGAVTRSVGERMILNKLKKGESMVICMVDLDGLKYVNDHYGHQKGDWYITTVCTELKKICRQGHDILSRYGGDEFVMAFFHVDSSEIEKRLQLLSSEVITIGKQQQLPIRISYGIAYSAAGAEFHELLAIADENMYRMKYLHKEESPEVVRG